MNLEPQSKLNYQIFLSWTNFYIWLNFYIPSKVKIFDRMSDFILSESNVYKFGDLKIKYRKALQKKFYWLK